ncbi:MAG: ATP-dependent RecD-like DNA helicase [Lachnospiraceae bacterium]|nr:ATP-dependent RecD-like DNA helicase [Lachnospiraceae bacterium]
MKISGTVDSILYREDTDGYTVLDLITEDSGTVRAVGCMPELDPGEKVIFEGEYRDHPTYGTQFRIHSLEIFQPEDREAIFRYLASGAVKGIREGYARKIVDRFGEDSYRIIEEEPERLSEIKGITINKAMEISASFEEKAAFRQAFSFLQQYGISNSLSQKIYKKYEAGLYEVIRTNPYQLVDDIEGIGFKAADRIASEAGILVNSEYRIRAGLLYLLKEAEGEGNLCLPEELLVLRGEELLSVATEEIAVQLDNLCVEHAVIRQKAEDGETRVYSARAFHAEDESARRLMEMNLYGGMDRKALEKDIRDIEKREGISLEELQREAVMKAVSNGVMILTGGPGTGKTTTLKLILKYFMSRGETIQLAAPTGRAAKRMSEAAGFPAMTIHRMLGLRAASQDQRGGFEHDEENPLETDVLIVDEMSMVDIYLFRALLRALIPGTRLILSGDENQLPSVGPGSVLRDMISSGAFSVVTLTKIYRQAEAGDIVKNAHNICEGKAIRLDNGSKDFFFLARDDPERIIEGLQYLILNKLPPYVSCNWADIQVMAPMRKGILGVESLNGRLQELLNPPSMGKQELEWGEILFREGDKVMQVRNNYELEWEVTVPGGFVMETGKGVFNGDLGVVSMIRNGEVTVRFDDGRQASYQGECLDELELAYAISIHKSQGSEYPAVIIPVLDVPRALKNRNLLYTGVTRARKCVLIMGRKRTVEEMIENTDEQKRYTGLKERIRELLRVDGDP